MVDVNASLVSGAFAIVGVTITAADRRFLRRALGRRISTVAEIFSAPTAPGANEQTELTSFAKDGVSVASNVVTVEVGTIAGSGGGVRFRAARTRA